MFISYYFPYCKPHAAKKTKTAQTTEQNQKGKLAQAGSQEGRLRSCVFITN
jgi:hypothetical protein